MSINQQSHSTVRQQGGKETEQASPAFILLVTLSATHISMKKCCTVLGCCTLGLWDPFACHLVPAVTQSIIVLGPRAMHCTAQETQSGAESVLTDAQQLHARTTLAQVPAPQVGSSGSRGSWEPLCHCHNTMIKSGCHNHWSTACTGTRSQLLHLWCTSGWCSPCTLARGGLQHRRHDNITVHTLGPEC